MAENEEDEFIDIDEAINDIKGWFERAEEFHCDDFEDCRTCDKLPACIHGLDQKADDILWYILQIFRMLKLFNKQADESFENVDKILGKMKIKRKSNSEKTGGYFT